MARAFLRDESGMTMGLVVIMIVLIGVMGAGLLTFVRTDLESVVNENQGERAFELAGAGIRAAKVQLMTNGGANPESYNGKATQDLRWSRCYGLPDTSSPPCTPPAGAGLTLTNLDGNSATNDSVNVTIEYTGVVSNQDTFVAISTGAYGDARRRVESVFKRNAPIQGLPPAFYTRNNLKISGNMSSTGLSFFALKNADLGSNSLVLGTQEGFMKKWALTNDSGSWPNDWNYTPRGTSLPGIAAGGTIFPAGASIETTLERGVKSFDMNTNPRVVPYYSQSALAPSQKIAFPFNIDALPNDLEILRQEAIRQEAADGRDHYVENLSGSHPIASWPTDSTYNTVYFYKYTNWNNNNDVQWNLSLPCTDETRKGIIVIENGNFALNGSKGGFNGTVLTYGGTDPVTRQPYADRGQFKASGGACMTGYATATGDMTLTGNFKAAATPSVFDLNITPGAVRQVSWRELYQ